MDPDLGRRAAEEGQNELRDALKGADMVFVTCGLGGGTGSGAAPVVAEIARDQGALTVAIVTKPFSWEGVQRNNIADDAYVELASRVDSIITIPNDRLMNIIDKKTTLMDSFAIVDDVLRQGVAGISEIITVPGLINVDYADVKAIMQNTGSALMGIGTASGDNRATEAAKMAIASPLLDLSIDGARGVLFTITGGPNLAMQEVHEAAKIISGVADDDARIIWGAVIDERLKDEVRITVVATGFPQDALPIQPISREDTASAPMEQSMFNSNIKQDFPPVDTPEQTKLPQKNTMPKAVKEMPQASQVSKEDVDEVDDELEIPAFIRKKMKK
jgi:cell division protein FtsZ